MPTPKPGTGTGTDGGDGSRPGTKPGPGDGTDGGDGTDPGTSVIDPSLGMYFLSMAYISGTNWANSFGTRWGTFEVRKNVL